jgi:hypothetical protein
MRGASLFSIMWIKKVNPFLRLDIERRCPMIGPILQALGQQIVPQVTQLINSPALGQFLRQIMLNPVARIYVTRAVTTMPEYVIRGVTTMPENVSNWYHALSDTDKKKLQNLVTWVAKDLAVDVATMATGLPIGPLVEKAIDWVLAELGHDKNPSPVEVSFIRSELIGRLNKG